MRCFICDTPLSPDEVKLHPKMKKWEPCGECLEKINEVFEPYDELEIDRQIALELFYEELVENNDNEQAITEIS